MIKGSRKADLLNCTISTRLTYVLCDETKLTIQQRRITSYYSLYYIFYTIGIGLLYRVSTK
jgi:hypothetical protein